MISYVIQHFLSSVGETIPYALSLLVMDLLVPVGRRCLMVDAGSKGGTAEL